MQDALILIVDDNELNREMAADILGSLGLSVEIADSGQTAIDMCKTKKYTAIMMDYMMPEMDGATATMQIRQEGMCTDIPILAMTAEEDPMVVQTLLESGMNAILHKPLDPSMLYIALGEFVSEPLTRPAGLDAEIQMDDVMTGLEAMGFDVSAGVKYTGSEALYRQYLKNFLKLLPGILDTMQTSMANKDYERFTIEVHGLKSNFRALGNQKLFAISQAFEKMGKEGKHENIDADYPSFYSDAQKCLEGLRNLTGAKDLLPALSNKELSVVLKELRDACDTFDLDTADYILDRLEAHAVSEAFSDHMKKLYDKIAGIEYVEAIELVDKILHRITEARDV